MIYFKISSIVFTKTLFDYALGTSLFYHSVYINLAPDLLLKFPASVVVLVLPIQRISAPSEA